jgi:DNA-binding transcriptional LysR family regulator
MLPDLDSLALFVRISELSSITRGASASFMSLPAASRRIALLEERFGTKLLDRTPRGAELTTTGQALLVHAKSLLRAVNQLQTELSDRFEGKLRLLATTSAMNHYLPTDIARLALEYPAIQLSIGEAWSEEVAQEVWATTADVGIIVEGTTGAKGLELLPYRSYHIGIVVPQGHPLALRDPVSFTEVLDHDIIALEGSSLMMRSLSEQAILAERTLAPKVRVRSFEAVCRFVQAGLGVGLLPYEAAIGLAGELDLTVKMLSESWAERNMVLCFRRDRMHNPSLKAVVDSLSRGQSFVPG